jgi:hypothetical protein
VSKSLTPLQKMTSTTPTALWNDSCSVAEIEYSWPRARRARRATRSS